MSTTLALASSTAPVDFRPMDNRIKELRDARGWTQQELADRAGTTNQQIGRLENGERELTVSWMQRLAKAFSVQPEELITSVRLVPVVGYVGAGAEAHYYDGADPPGEYVPMPPGGTDHTVGVEVRGDSLGSMFNTWLVYYDDVHDPPGAHLLRRLCVVGLEDGRVLVKKLRKGSLPGLFHLESQTEGTIEDVRVIWAAEVKAMTPK